MKNSAQKRISALLFWMIRHRRITILAFGVIGFLLPLIYGFVFGFPIPQAQDEMSYLVAADTFASGRLTNPTPALWQHFESSHLLFVPSYMSKYPPMQGIFLALGQVIFGYPIFGVWLSCGLAAAALFWMLLAWTKFKWAIFGTVLMMVFIGINSYWAQSYWGGMVAFSGGALFFGGFKRLLNKFSYDSTLLMIAGGIILVNSRPFEGFAAMCPALLILLVKIISGKKEIWRTKISQVILPGIILTSVALAGMFYYNHRVTSSWSNMPYAEHQRQYYPTPLFIFQQKDESANHGIEQVRRFYDGYTTPTVFNNYYETFGISDALYLRPFLAVASLLCFVPYFLFGLPLAILFYFFIPFAAVKNKNAIIMTVTVLFTFSCMSLATWWDSYHYSAPLGCCFYLLLIEVFRYCANLFKKRSVSALTLVPALIFAVAYPQFSPATVPRVENSKVDNNFIARQISESKTVAFPIEAMATFYKPNIQHALESLDGRFLIILTNDKSMSIHEAIVYNEADIENSKVIWAHDLGVEKNEELINFYKNRKVLRMTVSDGQIIIKPFR